MDLLGMTIASFTSLLERHLLHSNNPTTNLSPPPKPKGGLGDEVLSGRLWFSVMGGCLCSLERNGSCIFRGIRQTSRKESNWNPYRIKTVSKLTPFVDLFGRIA